MLSIFFSEKLQNQFLNVSCLLSALRVDVKGFQNGILFLEQCEFHVHKNNGSGMYIIYIAAGRLNGLFGKNGGSIRNK